MKKIGILTFHWAYNFGANLQTFSTYNNLLLLGYDPIIINWIPEDDEFVQETIVNQRQIEEHKSFINALKLTKLCRNSKDVASQIEENKIEAVIIGSDAVFNIRKKIFSFRTRKWIKPLSDHTYPSPFWGEFNKFLKNSIPISTLSVSCQNAPYKKFYKEREQIEKSLKKFKRITVRDRWTENMIRFFIGDVSSVQITPDPVWAFIETDEFFRSKKYILEKYGIPNDYVILSFENNREYFSGKWLKEFTDGMEKYASVVNLEKIIGNYRLDSSYHVDAPIPIEDWYYLIKYSKGYVGVLMHPLIVALRNNVPVYSFDTYGKKNLLRFPDKNTSKVYDIMKIYDLVSNYHMCTWCGKLPSATDVITTLTSFNYGNSMKHNAVLKEKYIETLKDLTQSFFC